MGCPGKVVVLECVARSGEVVFASGERGVINALTTLWRDAYAPKGHVTVELGVAAGGGTAGWCPFDLVCARVWKGLAARSNRKGRHLVPGAMSHIKEESGVRGDHSSNP